MLIIALYKFVSLPDFEALREPLRARCEALGIKGTLLLAHEGINGTVAGTPEAIAALLDYLREDPRLREIDWKQAEADGEPFYRLKIKLKKEIVTMGVPDIDPARNAGTYVEPKDWNALISDPEVVVIDTRNRYECEIGTFERAVDPGTDSFRQLPAFVAKHLDPARHKKVAMFCTGGIRCEKSTAYLKQQGFEEVYHLKGGILKYLEEVPATESLFHGECFVFDNRVAVNHALQPGRYELCHACRLPLAPEDKQGPEYIEGVSCPRCYSSHDDSRRERFRERQKQIELARARGESHIGAPPPARQQRQC